MKKLKIAYDKVADALYIRLSYDNISDTIEVEEGTIVDLNEDREIIGIEVINFSKSRFNLNKLKEKE